MKSKLLAITIAFLIPTVNAAEVITVKLKLLDESSKNIGRVSFEQTQWGLIINPKLHDLPPGHHGFHLHEFASCANNGLSAGGHYDPQKTGKHLGPYHAGHLGDLPLLVVSERGNAGLQMFAPRLNLKDLKGLALMIHQHGDNFSDTPKALGGGGARIACGVIPK